MFSPLTFFEYIKYYEIEMFFVEWIMKNVIAVFSNRSHTMQMASFLKRMGVRCKTISTPRDLSTSCGISVIFPFDNLPQARFVLDKYRFSSFNKMYVFEASDVFKKYLPL